MRTKIGDVGRFRLDLASLLSDYSIEVDEEALSRCEAHLEVLIRWNRVMNLVGDLSLESSVRRHYGESLFLASVLPRRALVLADIGSGGGFPGVGVAALRRESKVTLVESRLKKAAFLRESTRDWKNCAVFAGLGQDLSRTVDLVVSRGVDPKAVFSIAVSRSAGIGLLLASETATALAEQIVRDGYSSMIQAIPWSTDSAALVAFPQR